jgi:AcrR family transcriptional regulator
MKTTPREKILEAADQLFNEQGIQATSLAHIASAANVSKGTLFYHFKSKDDLILEIATQYIKTVEADVLALIEGKPESQSLASLALLLVTRVLEAKQRNRLHLYLIEESINRSPNIRSAMQGLYSQWIRLITEAIEPKAGKNAGVTAQLLLALIDGLVIQETLEINTGDIEAMLEIVFSVENVKVSDKPALPLG